MPNTTIASVNTAVKHTWTQLDFKFMHRIKTPPQTNAQDYLLDAYYVVSDFRTKRNRT